MSSRVRLLAVSLLTTTALLAGAPAALAQAGGLLDGLGLLGGLPVIGGLLGG